MALQNLLGDLNLEATQQEILSEIQRHNHSPFGDEMVAQLKQIMAIKAIYGIRDDVETFTATGGSVTASNGEFVCQTGTSVGGYGVLWSRHPVVYVPGFGCEARITARFTTGVASSTQLAGMFSAVDGMFFGYNGTSFGLMHRHHGELEVRTLTVTAASGGAATVTVTLNGTAYTASITSGTTSQNAHEIEQGLNAGAAASLWYIQHIENTVIFLAKSTGARSGTYSVTVSAGTFAGNIAQNKAGASPTEDWTAKASWNVDACSWLDPTKGNLYKVEFAYLGYGPLKYYVFNPTTLRWVLCHVISWPNVNTGTNFGNPSMRVGWVAASLGSTTNLTVAGASAMAGLQGNAQYKTTFGAYGIATGVTTESQVLSIQVRREFSDRACTAVVVPKILTIATDSTKGAVFRMLVNATVSGNTVHTYIDETNSVCTYDTAGTTITGGRLVGVFSTGPSGRAAIDISNLARILVNGDELVITAQVTSGAASEMTASLVWDEIV